MTSHAGYLFRSVSALCISSLSNFSMGPDYCPYNLEEIFCTIETVNLKFFQSVAVILTLILGFFFNFCFWFQREGKGGRKEGKETSNGCLLYKSQLRTEPATQARTLTGNWTCDLSDCGTMPNQLSHTSQYPNFTGVFFVHVPLGRKNYTLFCATLVHWEYNTSISLLGDCFSLWVL